MLLVFVLHNHLFVINKSKLLIQINGFVSVYLFRVIAGLLSQTMGSHLETTRMLLLSKSVIPDHKTARMLLETRGSPIVITKMLFVLLFCQNFQVLRLLSCRMGLPVGPRKHFNPFASSPIKV